MEDQANVEGAVVDPARASSYAPPAVVLLGTVAELTQGSGGITTYSNWIGSGTSITS